MRRRCLLSRHGQSVIFHRSSVEDIWKRKVGRLTVHVMQSVLTLLILADATERTCLHACVCTLTAQAVWRFAAEQRHCLLAALETGDISCIWILVILHLSHLVMSLPGSISMLSWRFSKSDTRICYSPDNASACCEWLYC